eukprot:gene2777-biopygen1028
MGVLFRLFGVSRQFLFHTPFLHAGVVSPAFLDHGRPVGALRPISAAPFGISMQHCHSPIFWSPQQPQQPHFDSPGIC